MDNLLIKEHTASEARENFFDLLRSAGKGAVAHQINLRSGVSVVMISKEELEGWLETLDIMSNPEEVKQIRNSKKEKRGVDHGELIKRLGLDEDSI